MRKKTHVHRLLRHKKLCRRCPEILTELCRSSHHLHSQAGRVIRKLPLDEEPVFYPVLIKCLTQENFYLFIISRANKYLDKHFFLCFNLDCVK